jgi:hypothetical protein
MYEREYCTALLSFCGRTDPRDHAVLPICANVCGAVWAVCVWGVPYMWDSSWAGVYPVFVPRIGMGVMVGILVHNSTLLVSVLILIHIFDS